MNINNKFYAMPLHIKTFDGTDSPYHPSVLYLNEPWNGFKYWMAETPFPPYRKPYTDRWECPSIHVSNDGIEWITPDGLSNPIDDLQEEEIKQFDFFSDPHIIRVKETMECWYRKTESNGKLEYFSAESRQTLCRKTSIDGIHWSKRIEVFEFQEKFGHEMVSPALLYDGAYSLWLVDTRKVNGAFPIVRMKSKDGNIWDDYEICSFSNAACKPWHIDVKFFDGVYWLVVYEFSEKIDLWKSTDGVNFTFVKNILSHKRVLCRFDEHGLYRASLVKVSNTDYRLYYSARGELQTSIGLLIGNNLESMVPGNARIKGLRAFIRIFNIMLHKARRHARGLLL